MLVIIIGIIGILSILGLLAIRTSYYNWLLFGATTIIALQLTMVITSRSVILVWGLFVAGIVFFISDRQRQQIFSKQLLDKLKEHWTNFNCLEPTTAVPGENRSVEKEMFCGNLQMDTLLQVPNFELTAKEQDFINNQVNVLCKMLSNAHVSPEQVKLPDAILEYLQQQKFFAMNISVNCNGLGFSSGAIIAVIQKIATCNINVAVMLMVPNSVELAKLLLTYGTNQQQQEYLSKLVTGEYVATLVLNSNKSVGIVDYQKYQDQEILGVLLTWEETNILLSSTTNLLILSVNIYDPNDFLCLNQKNVGKSICLIPINMANVVLSNGKTMGKNVFVPLNFIIGNKNLIGQNWDKMVDCLSAKQDVIFLALNLAISKLSFNNLSNYSVVYTEEIKDKLVKISGYNYMLDAIKNFLLIPASNNNFGIVTFMARYCIADFSKKVINTILDCYDINFAASMNSYLSIIHQNTLFGDRSVKTSILLVIEKYHPFLALELEAINTDNLEQFDYCFFAHMSYALSNFAKMVLHVITNKLFCQTTKELMNYSKDLNFFNVVFVCLIELSLLKYDERLYRRLWEIFKYIWVGHAILKYHNGLNKKDAEDVHLASWGLQVCLYHVQQVTIELLQNFSNKFVGKVIKQLIFSINKKYEMPTDELEHFIGNAVTNDSVIKTKLLSDCYLA